MTDLFWRGFLSGLVASLITGLVSFWLSKCHAEWVRKRDARSVFQMFLRSAVANIPESEDHNVLNYYREIKPETLRQLDRLWVFLNKAGKIKNDALRAYFDRELPAIINKEESDFKRGLHKALQEVSPLPASDIQPPHGETLKKALDEMMAL